MRRGVSLCVVGARRTRTVASPTISSSASSMSPLHPVVLHTSCRHQSSDQFHRYVNNPHIVQPDGLDSLPRTKADQQHWLNTEQWSGYSETYLKRHMQYPATAEHPNQGFNPRHNLLYECLGMVYELYGTLADELQELHDNPLHPDFHARIKRIKKERENIAKALDKTYAELHPTLKTIYDAYMVRRYYHLADWITYVEDKRASLFENLSPEYIRQAETAQQVSASFLRRLKLMERDFYRSPELGLLSNDELEQYTTGELAMLRQKAAYFRKMRRFGANQLDSDVHTH